MYGNQFCSVDNWWQMHPIWDSTTPTHDKIFRYMKVHYRGVPLHHANLLKFCYMQLPFHVEFGQEYLIQLVLVARRHIAHLWIIAVVEKFFYPSENKLSMLRWICWWLGIITLLVNTQIWCSFEETLLVCGIAFSESVTTIASIASWKSTICIP